MTLFEVQFRASEFLAAQLQTLRLRKISIPPQTIGPTTIHIQRVTFGDNSFRRGSPLSIQIQYRDYQYNPVPPYLWTLYEATGYTTDIAQPLTIHASTEEAVMSAAPFTEAPSVPIQLMLVLRLAYYPANGGCVLSTYLDDIEWGALPALPPGLDADEVKKQVEQTIRATFSTPTVPFNFATLLPPGLTEIANAGVSVSKTLDIVAFRVEPLGSPSYGWEIHWQDFYQGNFKVWPITPDQKWAYFIHKKTLEPTLTRAVEVAVAKSAVKHFDVIGVGSYYSNPNGQPLVTTNVAGWLRLPVVPDVYHELNIRSSLLLLSNPPRLAVDIDLGDIKQLIDDVEDFVDTMKYVPPLGWVIDLAAGDELKELPKALDDIEVEAEGLVCQKITATHHRCTMTPPTPSVSGLRLSFSELRGDVAGVVITGGMHLLAFTPSELDIQPVNFAWTGPHVSCSQASNTLLTDVRANPENYAQVYLRVDIDQTGTFPIYLRDVVVINDPLGVFTNQVQVGRDQLPTQVVVEMPAPTHPDYVSNPYPFDLLVSTTAGIRLVRVPPPPAFDDGWASWVVSCTEVQLLACPNLPAWFGPGVHHFNLDWIVDPLLDPPYEEISHHIWDVTLEGLPAGHAVALQDSAGRTLDRVPRLQVSSKVTLHAVHADPTDQALRLEINGPEEEWSAEGRAAVGMEVYQQPVYRRSALSLAGPVRRMAASGRWTPAGVVAVTDNALTVIDVSMPTEPARLASWERGDIVDTAETPDRLLVACRDQLFGMGVDLIPRQLADDFDSEILAVEVVGESVCVLTEQSLELRAMHNLRIRSSHRLTEPISMQRLGSQLFVGAGHDIEVFGVAGKQLRHMTTHIDAGRLQPSYVAGAATLRALRSDGAPVNYAASQEGRIVVAGQAASVTTQTTLRIGPLVVSADTASNRVSIGVLGRGRLVVPNAESVRGLARHYRYVASQP